MAGSGAGLAGSGSGAGLAGSGSGLAGSGSGAGLAGSGSGAGLAGSGSGAGLAGSGSGAGFTGSGSGLGAGGTVSSGGCGLSTRGLGSTGATGTVSGAMGDEVVAGRSEMMVPWQGAGGQGDGGQTTTTRQGLQHTRRTCRQAALASIASMPMTVKIKPAFARRRVLFRMTESPESQDESHREANKLIGGGSAKWAGGDGKNGQGGATRGDRAVGARIGIC